MGRLGNQMFQFAALKSLSVHGDYDIKIPIQNSYNGQPGSHLLDVFETKVDILDKKDCSNIGSFYVEPYFHFNKDFFQIKDGTDVKGYFQSEKYFNSIEDIIRKDYIFKDEILQKAMDIRPCGDNLVSVHVRRGDYLKFADHHPPCGVEYYKKAMLFFKDACFLFFSDDIKWCENNFKGDQFLFSKENSDGVDLALMTMCDHNIIANSSFSWWGAWLNSNLRREVIAPKTWFGKNVKHNIKDLYCKEWKLI
jgi:hypothetical protein